ncbi:MAG: helix-turn-helix domain-containing protein [Methanospirillum sp.]|nr:helix-turn-helix domain-containing protein [Methanospirillum sp.]
MSEGLEILHFISTRGGCLLSELAVELGVPKSSVISWVSMLCSTGYLKDTSEKTTGCSCRNHGMKCLCCNSSCEEQKAPESRIEITERGHELIRRELDEKTGTEIVPGHGRLPRNDICAQ